MSLESLNALKQLVDVRGTGASTQGENLEKVQGEVQQQGTSEASRVDNLNLETVKAEYEKNLHGAQVERLQSQAAREQKAVFYTGIITGVVSILALGDFAVNLKKDLSGGQKNKDLDPNSAVSGIADPNKASKINEKRDGTTAGASFIVGGSKDGKGQTVYMTEKNGQGSTTSVGAAQVTAEDIQRQVERSGITGQLSPAKIKEMEANPEMAKALGYDKDTGTIDIKKIDSFEKLAAVDMNAAKAIFKDPNVSHDIGFGEVGNFMEAEKKAGQKTLAQLVGEGAKNGFMKGGEYGAIGGAVVGGLPGLIAGGVTGATLGGLGGGAAALIRGTTDNDTTSIKNKLEQDGKTGTGWKDFKNGAKSTLNGVIQLAETVVPFFQALLAAKDKAQNTEEELQMAMEKFAAAEKKLKQLEMLIVNAGSGGMGKI
jgi:hypothetical protein